MNTPILITGHPRSGTSLMSGIFAACGAWRGNTVAGNKLNPRGFYENIKLLRIFYGHYTMRQIARGVKPPVLDIPKVKAEFETEMRNQGYRRGPWIFKFSGIATVFDQWMKAWPNTLCIVARRDAAAADASHRRLIQYYRQKHTSTFVEDLRDHLEEYIKRCVAGGAVEVLADEVVDTGGTVLRPLVEKAGLTWNNDEVEAFVDPGIWNRRSL